MGTGIASAEQVTAEWLTAKLYNQGALTCGEVTSVIPGAVQPAFASSIWRLAVNYSRDASPGAPAQLFLKVSNPALAPGELDPKHLEREIVYYTEIAPAMHAPFSIPCYDAEYEPQTGASHILLKDVADTHTVCPTPFVRENCEQAVDALAHFHAFWWDHPRLGQDIGRFPTPEERQQSWLETEQSTTAFVAALGDQLLPRWRTIYQQVLPALPALFKRHAAGRNLTLAHGDAHLGNFLFPKDSLTASVYIIDWQFWHATIAGTDLAFMMAAEWETETRRLWERELLQRYYSRLLERGVRDYPWEACWNDYRLSVILLSIFIPVWRWAIFKWAPDMVALQRSMTAFEDLKCSDLL